MNLNEMVRLVRATAQDTSEYSYLWSDEEIIRFLNEGQIEACRYAPWLLRSSSLGLGETRAKCEITVSGTYGTISSITVNSVNIISNSVVYTNDDNTTAALLANEINDNSLFEATVKNNIVTLFPLEGNGSFYNNMIPIITSTNSFTTVTAFAGGVDGICRIQLKPNVKEYKFSKKLLKIEGFYLGTKQKKMIVKDFTVLNEYDKSIISQKGDVEAVFYGMSNDSFYVGKLPAVKDYLNMTVCYLPLKELKAQSDIPEIAEQYHSKLIHYALYKMYQKNDIEAEQLDISNFHYMKFIEEFGDNQFAAASGRNNQQIFFGA